MSQTIDEKADKLLPGLVGALCECQHNAQRHYLDFIVAGSLHDITGGLTISSERLDTLHQTAAAPYATLSPSDQRKVEKQVRAHFGAIFNLIAVQLVGNRRLSAALSHTMNEMKKLSEDKDSPACEDAKSLLMSLTDYMNAWGKGHEDDGESGSSQG